MILPWLLHTSSTGRGVAPEILLLLGRRSYRNAELLFNDTAPPRGGQ